MQRELSLPSEGVASTQTVRSDPVALPWPVYLGKGDQLSSYSQ